MIKNHLYVDACLLDDGATVWLDSENAQWVWQASDDERAKAESLTVGQAIGAVPADFRGWVLEATFDALIGLNVTEALMDGKAKFERGHGQFLPDEEWQRALRELCDASQKFERLASELVSAAQPLG